MLTEIVALQRIQLKASKDKASDPTAKEYRPSTQLVSFVNSLEAVPGKTSLHAA
jgi:hypothetical protein